MMQMGEVGLLLDPGLGKSSTSLMAFKILKEKGIVRKALIITPLRPMFTTWPNELKKWDDFNHFTYSIIHREKEAALKKDVDIYLINPEGLKWLASRNRKDLPDFDVLIVDESTKFKDSSTLRFKLLKGLLPSFSRRWILTGTPVPNGLHDLFGQIYILDQGAALGRFITWYRRRFFYQIENDWYPRKGAFEDISEIIAPFCIRLKAEDYLQMPALLQTDIVVQLPEKVREVYKQVEDNFFAAIDDYEVVAKNKAAAGTKLRQVANGAVYIADGQYEVLHDEKIEATKDLIEQLNGNPVILVYEFISDRDRLKKAFPKAQVMTGLSTPNLKKAEQMFNEGKIAVLLMHAGSAAGLNLQAVCHHVIWFGLTWNLEHYIQTNDRVFRQGQQSECVYIYHIVCAGTKDETVAEALRQKDIDQEKLLKLVAEKSNAFSP